MTNNRRIRPYVFLIVFLSVILHILQISEVHQWGDFALYLLQTKAIVEGTMDGLLAVNTFSVDSSNVPTGPNLYPWGFPLLLVPIYFLFGLNLYALKVYLILIFGCALITMFFIFRKKLGDLAALLLIGIFAFNPLFISYNNLIQSDIPFLLFCLLTILYIQKLVVDRPQSKLSYLEGFLLGVLIFLSYFVRSNGIVFLPILLFCQLVRIYQEKKNFHLVKKSDFRINFFFPYIIFFCLLFLSNHIFPEGSSSHYNRFEMVNLHTLADNLVYYLKLPTVFYPRASLAKVVYYGTLPLAIIGILFNFRRDYLYILFCLASISICIIWPYAKGIRFIFPILPFYVYFLFKGLSWVQSRFMPGKISLQHAFAGVLILFFTSVFINRIISSKTLEIDGPYASEAEAMFKYIAEHTPAKALVIFRKPRSMMLFTDRVSFRENRNEKLSDLSNAYIVVDKKYYITDRDFEKFDTSMLSKRLLVYKNDRFEIYHNMKHEAVSISKDEKVETQFNK